MSQTKCINANRTKINGAMTIAVAGAIPASDTSKQDFSLAELNSAPKGLYGAHVYLGNTTATSGNLGTAACLPLGSFAYQNKTQFIMSVAGRYINGTASTLFQSPANRISPRSLNKQGAVHTAYLTVLTWTSGHDGLPTYTKTVSSQAPSFGADDATLTIAEFCYRTGKPLPVQADYQAKYTD